MVKVLFLFGCSVLLMHESGSQKLKVGRPKPEVLLHERIYC